MFLVVGELYGDVSYGVDHSLYAFGVYPTMEEAIAKKKQLENDDAEKRFVDEDCRFMIKDGHGLFITAFDESYYDEEELKDITEDDFVHYKDFYFHSIPIPNNAPVYIGGASYLE